MWNTRTNIDWVARPPIMNSLDMKAQNIKIFSSVNTAWEHPDSDFNLWEKIRASTFFFNWDIILPLSQVLHEDDETSLLIIAFMYLFLKSLNCFWRVRGGSSLHVSSQYKINKSYWLRDWLWDWLWDCWRGKIPSDDEFVTLLATHLWWRGTENQWRILLARGGRGWVGNITGSKYKTKLISELIYSLKVWICIQTLSNCF